MTRLLCKEDFREVFLVEVVVLGGNEVADWSFVFRLFPPCPGPEGLAPGLPEFPDYSLTPFGAVAAIMFSIIA